MIAKRNSLEGDTLGVLVTLIEAYEAKHFPLDLPHPVEAIKLVIEQRDLTVKALVPYIGQPNRVYEVLNRKRRPATGRRIRGRVRTTGRGYGSDVWLLGLTRTMNLRCGVLVASSVRAGTACS